MRNPCVSMHELGHSRLCDGHYPSANEVMSRTGKKELVISITTNHKIRISIMVVTLKQSVYKTIGWEYIYLTWNTNHPRRPTFNLTIN